jgi:hypothetical protein
MGIFRITIRKTSSQTESGATTPKSTPGARERTGGVMDGAAQAIRDE